MATLQTWADRTRSHLMSGRMELRNTLSLPYVAGSGTMTLTNAISGVVVGLRLSVGLNSFYVAAVPGSGTTITVLGGQEGTVDVDAAAGALVRVGPRFTDADIVDALATELVDLSAPDNGLFQIKTVDLTYSYNSVGYDLAGVTDLIDVYELQVQESGSSKGWERMGKALYRLDRNALASVFPSGLGLQVNGTAWNGLALRLLYRSGFTVPTALATDLTTTGLPTTAWDIPPMGAAMRLVALREVKRSFTETQGDTRRAAEVPPGAVAQSMRSLSALRMSRVQSEAARLCARYPDRRW